MASKGVVSGSGTSMASGRFVLIEGCEGLRIQKDEICEAGIKMVAFVGCRVATDNANWIPCAEAM